LCASGDLTTRDVGASQNGDVTYNKLQGRGFTSRKALCCRPIDEGLTLIGMAR